MQQETRERIKERIRDKMNGILNRRIRELNEDMQELYTRNPFGARLVPEMIWKGSKFERSFVTSFGQGVYEQIAYEIAIDTGATAQNQHGETVIINTWQADYIDDLLSRQRNNDRNNPVYPDWTAEINEGLNLRTNRVIEIPIRFDLYIRRIDGTEEYYSIKTVKPNLDQTEIAKRDMMRTTFAKENARTYFALPYNPAGEGTPYNWNVINKIFNTTDDSAVLIGSDFWNTVGQDPNTYNELLEIFDELGDEYHRKIQQNYIDL